MGLFFDFREQLHVLISSLNSILVILLVFESVRIVDDIFRHELENVVRLSSLHGNLRYMKKDTAKKHGYL